MADRDGQGLIGLVIWKVLNILPRQSEEPEHKSSYRPRRVQDVARTRREKSAYCDFEPEIRHLTPRKHRLSIMSSEDEGDERRPSNIDQQAASLLFKLPKELRLRVYEEVCGGNIIHIVRRRKKLGHRLCKGSGDPEQCILDNCRGFKLPTGFHAGSGNGGLIQLLQSCRRMQVIHHVHGEINTYSSTRYSEAIWILYTSNVFNFDSLESFVSFSCEVLPQRLDSIQKIQLDFRFNLSVLYTECTPRSNWPRWERTWRIIASMVSLNEVRMRFSWPEMTKNDREELRILKPLQLATGLKVFKITMPFLRNTSMRDRDDLPFRIATERTQGLMASF